jgi:acyl-CoA synthetase (AMP-forming)/AMP-acid ligase II
LRPDAQIAENEILAWLEGKVARYKMPKRIFFWEELPKSGYGKITKRTIRAELEARFRQAPDAAQELSARTRKDERQRA